MHKRRGLFFQSLVLTLLLVIPMMGTVVFFASQRTEQQLLQQAAADQTQLAEPAGARQTHRLLLAVQADTPAFLLLRLDGPEQAALFCALPGNLVLQAPAGTTTLAECYLAAGPARAEELLGQTLGMAPDAYLAATANTWADLWGLEDSVRFDTAAVFTAEERRELDCGEESVVELTAFQAADFLARAAALPDQTPAALSRARGALWAAFFRQFPDNLANLADGARNVSSRTLTDLRAQDIYELEETLTWLSGASGYHVDYQTLELQQTAGGSRLTAADLETVQTLLAGGTAVE